jgi:MobA/MobL family
LPPELDPQQRIALARSFSREIADRYGVAVDLAVHEPRPDGDPRNFHAHILTTTRAMTPTGLGAKIGLDMNGLDRYRRGLPNHRLEYVSVRERWAQLTNTALREAGIDASIDHRSYAAQGIDREPRAHIPEGYFRVERGGGNSEIAAQIRAQYQERVEQRLTRAAKTGAQQAAPRAADAAGDMLKAATQVTDLEEVRRKAREAWLALRAGARAEQGTEKGHDAAAPQYQPEDDLAR